MLRKIKKYKLNNFGVRPLLCECSHVWSMLLNALSLALLIFLGLVIHDDCYAVAPMASLELSNTKLEAKTMEESTAITNTKVNASIANAASYNLTLSFDNVSLINDTTIIKPGNVTDDNTWGYKWEEESFYHAPNATNELTVPNLGSNNAISFSKNLTFAVKFGKDADAGTYSTKGTISLTAQPAITYTLLYNANGGDTASIPSSQTCMVAPSNTDCIITISGTVPTRADYEFLGWADSADATDAQYAGETNVSIATNRVLYAVWKKSIKTLDNITTMQEMTKEICAASAIGKDYSLKDSRDGAYYTVRKFADARCWMTSNLRITGSRVLTLNNSNVSSNYSLLGSNLNNFSSSNSNQGVYLSNSIGYYSWCAATAGTCGSTTVDGNAPSSICPKGWKLPSGSNSGDYAKLFASEKLSNFEQMQASPYNFGFTGWIYIDNGIPKLGQTSSVGYWWTSTPYGDDSTSAYRLLNGSLDRSSRYRGMAIRCVAQY